MNMPRAATAKRPPITPPAIGPASGLLVLGGGAGEDELEGLKV